MVSTVTGNVFTYSIADFATINNQTAFRLIMEPFTTAQAGDPICVSANVTPLSGDNNTANNEYTACYYVVNSHDPNFKEVYPVDVQPGFDDWLTYTIHFQNTGNAPAMNIMLADTLDQKLDMKTFQVTDYSHANTITFEGRKLMVNFSNIQLPDSTTDAEGSIGFIQYRLKSKPNWYYPYKIKNTAYIYFDFNAPIITNTTYNSIYEFATRIEGQKQSGVSLYPNPNTGTFTIELGTKEKQTVELFDITGNTVLLQTIDNGKAVIDAGHLAAGIYNISIKGNNSVINQKLVIVK